MKGEILSVGTELLLGHLVDTNAPYLAQSLSALGIDVYWISQVGDNQARLVQALRRGWERSDLMVLSGGLGPTGDDLTRESIAELLGEQMIREPELEADLRAFFARRGRSMPDRNLKQATLIPSSRPLLNPIGTAPGWWVEKDGRVIVAMPGVPVEMKRMWEQLVAPRLAMRAGGGVIQSRTLKVLGLGESAVEEEIKDLTASPNPTAATYAKQDGVHVRITAKAPDAETAGAMIAEMESRARGILGDHIYGVDDQTVPDAVGRLLQMRGLTLAAVETCTAGQLASALATASVGSEFFAGSVVAHGPALLSHLGLGGLDADGFEDSQAMAAAGRVSLGADVGLAVTCSTEKAEGNGQSVGVVRCAIDYRGEISSSVARYATTAAEIRRRAVLEAMDLLRRRLLKG